MPTHSLDLRQRVVAAYQAGKTSIRQVAERFMVTKKQYTAGCDSTNKLKI